MGQITLTGLIYAELQIILGRICRGQILPKIILCVCSLCPSFRETRFQP